MKIQSGLPSSSVNKRKAASVLAGIVGIRQLEGRLGIDGVFNFGTLMNPKKVDSEELRQFLVRNPCSDTTTWNDTQWVKLVCFYDWLVHGLGQT